MKRLSFRLSQAVAGGRAAKAAPESRGVVLERLLRKRAAAYQAGLDDQEQMLRDQIKWSLPIERGIPRDLPGMPTNLNIDSTFILGQ